MCLTFDFQALSWKPLGVGRLWLVETVVRWYGINLGSAKVCSPAINETYFSSDKGIWIAATDY